MAKITFQIMKKNFEQIIKNHRKNSCKYSQYNVLGGVNIKLTKDKKLRFASTDGDKLLITDIKDPDILKTIGSKINVIFDLKKIAPIKYLRGCKAYDSLIITIDTKNGMTIEDKFNNVVYKFPVMEGQFPAYEKIVDFDFKEKQERQSVFLNKQYLQDILASTAADIRNNVVELNISKENKLHKIYVAGKNNELNVETFSVLMPCQVREYKE